MRAILLVATLCMLAVAVPAPVEAHTVTCNAFDVPCVAQCPLSHQSGVSPGHECRIVWPMSTNLLA